MKKYAKAPETVLRNVKTWPYRSCPKDTPQASWRIRLLYILPAVLFFSYNPVISLGTTTSMNLELSLPLIWLALFTVLSLPSFPKSLKSFISIFPQKSRLPLALLLFAFPVYLTISTLWSPNPLRAFLTAGIFWCLILSILTISNIIINNNIKRIIVKITLISSVVISLFCWLQCILDIMDVPREATLLCQGCTYRSFGFPHPNGFAIEPQFMGNLLLAPCFLALFLLFKRGSNNLVIKSNRTPSKDRKLGRTASSVSLDGILLLFRSNLVLTTISIFLIATLFLTFSRGAIYAFLLASIILIIINLFQKHRQILWSIPIIITAFLLSLLAQGIFAQLSPTSDTFASGVSKAISQLTLGHINLEHNEDRKHQEPSLEGDAEPGRRMPLGTHPRISAEKSVATDFSDAPQERTAPDASYFSGYVPESTEVRVSLTNYALSSWQDYKLFGSGLASSGTILYERGYTSTPKEIVQNEYSTLLLETGIIGCLLLIISLVILAKFTIPIINPSVRPYLLCLILAYSATLFFFSGLPNALHIYLLPALFFSLTKISSSPLL